MSFYGTSFSFDGVSCEEFGLMIYDLDSATQGASSWAKGTKINEERNRHAIRSIYYGKTEEASLEFTLVFGANEYAAHANEPIDRYEMQLIAQWLTGPSGYCYLHIDQPDMEDIQYRCIITDLKMVELFGKKWGFSCNVHCDSPYAYTRPKTYTFATNFVNGSDVLESPSTANCLHRPKIIFDLDLNRSNTFSISNRTLGHVIAFRDVPRDAGRITVDCERAIITAESGVNMYQFLQIVDSKGDPVSYNPFDFLALKPGANRLMWASCIGSVTVECEFPMNVGG